MDIDKRESKGRGTLLHVIKRDSNAQVSSLNESIEPAPRPSNHLITTGPKLDGNTLHIKVSFLECSHSLVEVTYVLHKICMTVVHGECGLSEPLRKSPFLNPTCERRSENLFEHSTYRIIPQAFRR